MGHMGVRVMAADNGPGPAFMAKTSLSFGEMTPLRTAGMVPAAGVVGWAGWCAGVAGVRHAEGKSRVLLGRGVGGLQTEGAAGRQAGVRIAITATITIIMCATIGVTTRVTVQQLQHTCHCAAAPPHAATHSLDGTGVAALAVLPWSSCA